MMPRSLPQDKTRTRSPEHRAARIRSPLLIKGFSLYVRRYLARSFSAVRISRTGLPPEGIDGPLVMVLNHPSWWDPLICVLLADFFPEREHYAPIDSGSLENYPFFERLGFFGIEMETFRGAAGFLRTALAILERPGASLWVTAQGRFSDVRERPASIQPGVAHLAKRLRRGAVVPLALEYVFWNERFPEALARFGKPIRLGEQPDSIAGWKRRIERGLEAAQDGLAREARLRDPERFVTIRSGRSGMGGIYGAWRSLKSYLGGKRAAGGAASGTPSRGGAA